MFKVLLAVLSYAWITEPGPIILEQVSPRQKQDPLEEKKEVLKTLDHYPEFKKIKARL